MKNQYPTRLLRKWSGPVLLLFLLFSNNDPAQAKNKSTLNSYSASKSDQKIIHNLCSMNHQKQQLCLDNNDSSTTAASPTPSPLYSDSYFNRSKKDGISQEIDWLWISALGKLDPMMPRESDDLYSIHVDLMKKTKTEKQMLMMKMGKCWINMSGKYGLNETQDKMILIESTSYDLTYPDNCTFGTEGCIKINGKTHRVLARNKADPPLTKETMNTDYLKPIRDAKELINEKCR